MITNLDTMKIEMKIIQIYTHKWKHIDNEGQRPKSKNNEYRDQTYSVMVKSRFRKG